MTTENKATGAIMKMLNNLLQRMFIMVFLLAVSNVVSAEPNELTMAYVENGLTELRNNEKQVALQLLVNELIKDSGFKMVVKPFSTFAQLQRSIVTGDVDFLIINSFHYISHADFFHKEIVEPIWSVLHGPLDYETHILVAHKRYAELSLQDFKGKQISFYTQHLMMNFNLEYIVKKASGLDSSHFFKKIKSTKTASQAVLDVYFGGSDLCVIPKYLYDLTVELNPAMLKKIVIIKPESEQFIPVLLFNFKHTDPAARGAVNKNIAVLDETVRGKQIMEIFKVQIVNLITEEELEPMRKLFQTYQAL